MYLSIKSELKSIVQKSITLGFHVQIIQGKDTSNIFTKLNLLHKYTEHLKFYKP